MEKFPDDFNLASCMSTIENNQKSMTVKVREEFYNKVLQSVQNCDPYVHLVFPKNLWSAYKVAITAELLNRFGEIETITNNKKTNSTVSNPITDAANISKSIDSIIIRFMHE